MFRWVPGLQAVSSYQRIWLARDIIAGVVLTTLLVPQGMAYAELAGLPPVTGLYTSILCLLGYAMFGPSRILVLGPDSSLGPMIAATILPLIAANGDEKRAVALAALRSAPTRPRGTRAILEIVKTTRPTSDVLMHC
jgi:MFS superfamily sulfate permease-like transporter